MTHYPEIIQLAQAVADTARAAIKATTRADRHDFARAMRTNFAQLRDAVYPRRQHVDYDTFLDLGAATMSVGINYTYVPADPGMSANLDGPGEPSYPASAEIDAVYWRADDTHDWREADDDLAELIVESFGGDDCLISDLVAHAEGRAEDAACEAADWRRGMIAAIKRDLEAAE